MKSDRRLGQYLGTAFLVVFAGSALSGALSASVLSGSTAETLENIADNSAQLRWSTMIDLCITSTGIVVLAALLYTVLRKQNPILALVALGWWLAEAITLAVSTVGAFILIPVSEAYVQAGASASSSQLALGDTLIEFDRVTWEIHMLFYGLGALVWYSLMYQSRCVPRWLSMWGVLAVGVGLFSSVLFLASDIDWFFMGFPTGLFEVVIGVWLIFKGISRTESDPAHAQPDVRRAEPVLHS
jgi:hypothetical protein